jgi:RNA polymerase sigma-70 factor (ECF subfamily)
MLDERAGVEMERLDTALSVRQAMHALSDDCREILDRFFAEDQTYADIARDLEMPMGTIASRISRCLSKLRTILDV